MIDREGYIDARLREDPLRGSAKLTRTPEGFVRDGRPYIVLRCHCRAEACAGWAPVHQEPAAVAYFLKLFGQPASPPLPHPPAAAVAVPAEAAA